MRDRFVCLALSFLLLAASDAPGIVVKPTLSAVDAPIEVSLLRPPGWHIHVTLSTHLYGMLFSASEDRVVPPDGRLLLGMDLFWKLLPQGPPSGPVSFARDSELATRTYTLTASGDGSAPITAEIQRFMLAPTTTRRVVDDGPLVATLFANSNAPCQAGVVVLGGSDGGVPEPEAAVIAAHGFTTLALAYFGVPGLPKTLVNIPLETVERGVAFLKSNGSVCHDRPIGLIGTSKGAEMALAAAARFSDIGAVVAVSPSSIVFGGIGDAPAGVPDSSWSYQGTPLPFANGTVPKTVIDAIRSDRAAKRPISYQPEYLAQLTNNTDEAATIPVENIAGPVLLVAGGADELWPSLIMARRVEQRLRDHHHAFDDLLLAYPDAGHPISGPYQLAAAQLAHGSLALGGTAEANERASEDSWPKIIAFFTRALAKR